MEIKKVGVLGCGLMGAGIAQTAAMAGFETTVREVSQELIQKGFASIEKSLERFADKGTITAEQQKATRDRLFGTTSFDDLADCDIIIEAIIENLDEKQKTYRELDAADTDGDERADLEELAADGCAGGLGKIGSRQGNPAQAVDEDIGHRGEPQAQLVGAEGGGRGTIGKQIELTFLDAVFHLATRAVDLLVEMTRIAFGLRQGGDDEARVCLVLRPLGLGNDATLATPARAR